MAVSFSLVDQVALVTGASKGIGQAIAVALAQAGARVACTARTADALGETLGLIAGVGGVGIPVEWDVRDPQAAGPAVAEVEERLGPLRFAVNNAGVGAGTPALEITPDQWRSVYSTNVDGVFWSCQAQARAMRAGGGGAIVNIASISGHIANRNLTQSQYNSGKAAVIHLTRSLAVEWAGLGIRVNAVSPGYTLTPMNQRPEVADLVAEFADTTPWGGWRDRRRSPAPSCSCSAPRRVT